MKETEGKSEESLDWSLHGGGGQLCVLGVDTAGALRDRRLAPGSHLAEARGLLQSLHHGLLTDCGQEDENTLRETRDISLLSLNMTNLQTAGLEDPELFERCKFLHSLHDQCSR